MKKIFIFCVLGGICTGNAFGAVNMPCTLNINCGDGNGPETRLNADFGAVWVRQFPNNTGCSKDGAAFDHWSVSANGTVVKPIVLPGESFGPNDCPVSLTLTAVYVSNGTITSKPFVDDAVSTRQDKIPAANPSNSFHETSPSSDTVVGVAAAVGSMPQRILASRVNPVPSRLVAVLKAFVPPNQ